MIDCTGSSNVIDYIISNCETGSTILLVGTPENDTFLNIYNIHKKNIHLIGGHEITGIDWATRQKEFRNLYDWHKSRVGEFREYIHFYCYSVNTLRQILVNNTDKPFCVFEY